MVTAGAFTLTTFGGLAGVWANLSSRMTKHETLQAADRAACEREMQAMRVSYDAQLIAVRAEVTAQEARANNAMQRIGEQLNRIEGRIDAALAVRP